MSNLKYLKDSEKLLLIEGQIGDPIYDAESGEQVGVVIEEPLTPEQIDFVMEHRGFNIGQHEYIDSSVQLKGYKAKPVVNPDPVEITIESITNIIQVNTDNTWVTCLELQNVIITGTLVIPDRMFSVPVRRDDGRLFLFPAEVTNGQFQVTINLPTTGQFVYSDEECNVDLPYKMFTVKKLKIDCLRQITQE